MPSDLRCPRCLRCCQRPGLRSSRYTCVEHGEVAPLHAVLPGGAAPAAQLAARSKVPVWLPWPLPPAWLVTGLQAAGDDHSGWLATVVALSGPHPLAAGTGPRSADLLIVAEQPAIGLGARLAGMADVDPGLALQDAMSASPPHAVLQAAGHTVPLWTVPGDAERAVYAGEAASVWLWLIALPTEAGAMSLENLRLVDLRDPEHPLDLPTGAPSSYLV